MNADWFIADCAVRRGVPMRAGSMLLDWRPCTGPACPVIGVHGSVSVPDSAVIGLTATSQEVVVYWWRALADSSAHVAHGVVRAVVAKM